LTIITDYLENIAKAMAEESYNATTHLIVATGDNTTIDLTATALDGEIGTRQTLTRVRTSNRVNFTAVRDSTDVVDTVNGDSLTGAGMDIALTGSNLQVGVGLSELHTTSFDLEFDFELTYDRG